MKKIVILGLALVLIFSFSFCFAEDDPMAMLRKQQQEYLKTMQQDSPKLYEFEKKLMDIQQQIQEVLADLQRGRTTKEKARGILTPLVKEDMAIRDNPDYMLEQRVNMLLNMSQMTPPQGARKQ